MQECETKLHKLLLMQQKLREKSELYKFQLNELTQYPLSINFEKEIVKQYNRLSMASEIQSSLSTVGMLLEEGDYAVINSLNKIRNELEKVSEFD